MSGSSLSFRDALLALAVVFVWGTNFVVIRLALNALPPLLFAALRFTSSWCRCRLLPASARNSDPCGPIWSVMALAIGLGQFGLLFIAMNGMISPGLASLVVQMQVFFTIGLSMLRTGERLEPHQMVAFVLAHRRHGVIVAHNGRGATIAGVLLTLAAAVSWAHRQSDATEAGQVNILSYVVWASLFSLPPLYRCR